MKAARHAKSNNEEQSKKNKNSRVHDTSLVSYSPLAPIRARLLLLLLMPALVIMGGTLAVLLGGRLIPLEVSIVLGCVRLDLGLQAGYECLCDGDLILEVVDFIV